MLDKLTGVFAPRPSTGPHKLRECLPLIIFLRNRLKYALTGDEVKKICMQRFIKIDGKVRTDVTYPAGFMGEFFQFLFTSVAFLSLMNNLKELEIISSILQENIFLVLM
uniref:Ribosomal protein S4 X-linked n=1 Tax=Kryptolebias marmoratus TaxID=37003 RepID=A0A3Q3AUA0_KRYMA